MRLSDNYEKHTDYLLLGNGKGKVKRKQQKRLEVGFIHSPFTYTSVHCVPACVSPEQTRTLSTFMQCMTAEKRAISNWETHVIPLWIVRRVKSVHQGRPLRKRYLTWVWTVACTSYMLKSTIGVTIVHSHCTVSLSIWCCCRDKATKHSMTVQTHTF